jgi:hypothetical protein
MVIARDRRSGVSGSIPRCSYPTPGAPQPEPEPALGPLTGHYPRRVPESPINSVKSGLLLAAPNPLAALNRALIRRNASLLRDLEQCYSARDPLSACWNSGKNQVYNLGVERGGGGQPREPVSSARREPLPGWGPQRRLGP